MLSPKVTYQMKYAERLMIKNRASPIGEAPLLFMRVVIAYFT